MADLNPSEGLRLSAQDIKSLTNWPDALIEDYLSMTRLINDAVIIINNNSEKTPAIESMLSHLRGVFDQLAKTVNNLEEEIASLPRTPLPSKHHKTRIDSHEQQLAADESLMALDRARLSKSDRELSPTIAGRILIGL